MNEAVTDVIVSRARDGERLSSMLAWSIAAHVVITALVLLLPEPAPPGPAPTPMMISLGGAEGPKTGGLTQMGGRAVQAPEPEQPVTRAETPPAPKPPPMTLPDPRSKPQPRPRPQQAPEEASGRKPTTGPQPREGSERTETQNRGQGFGLSSGGGGGDGVTLDVTNFCCPEYILDMRARIQRHWNPRQGLVGISTVKFTIDRSGSVYEIQLTKSSGFTKLDQHATRAMTLTAGQGLAPLPAAFPNPTLTVHLEFAYVQ